MQIQKSLQVTNCMRGKVQSLACKLPDHWAVRIMFDAVVASLPAPRPTSKQACGLLYLKAGSCAPTVQPCAPKKDRHPYWDAAAGVLQHPAGPPCKRAWEHARDAPPFQLWAEGPLSFVRLRAKNRLRYAGLKIISEVTLQICLAPVSGAFLLPPSEQLGPQSVYCNAWAFGLVAGPH